MKRKAYIGFRLSEDERALLEAAAVMRCGSMSELVREATVKSAAEVVSQGQDIPVPDFLLEQQDEE